MRSTDAEHARFLTQGLLGFIEATINIMDTRVTRVQCRDYRRAPSKGLL